MEKEELLYLAMFLPGLFFYLFFKFIPIIWSFVLSLYNWNILSPPENMIGFQNYINLLSDTRFIRAFWNTLYFTLGSVLLQISFGIIFAYLTYRKGLFGRFFRSVIYFPSLISFIIGGMLISWMFDPGFGIINEILRSLNLGQFAINWLASPVTSMPVILLAITWQGLGLYVILFTVAMQSIPESIYDSIKIDGIGSTRALIQIIIPMIKGTVLVGFIFIVSSTFKTFDIVFVMTFGGPLYLTEVLAFYLYRSAFELLRGGYAVAIGVIMLIVSFVIVLLYVRVAKPEVSIKEE